MPKIVALIEQQAFELIRDRILEILIEEINHQQTLSDPVDTTTINYYIERSGSVHYNECPLINVSLSRGDYSNRHAANVDGSYSYNIDVYCSAEETTNSLGESIASLNMQKLLGLCRAILDNPVYKKLGFVANIIQTLSCSNFTIADPIPQDAHSVMMGRLVVNVKATETTEKLSTVLIAGYETEIRVSSGTTGFHYSKPVAQ